MKINLLIIFLISFAFSISAQSVKKGYKSLEKGDYAKAKESFQKNLAENKDHMASNFGMAMILADDKSPYFNIVDSWEYILKVKGKMNELSQEEIEIMSSYFLATEVRKTSRPVKKKIAIAVDAVDSRLIKYIREENNLEAVYAVLEKYPDYPHYDNVVHIRNQFEYRKYEKLNTQAGYEEFIQKFPEAAQVAKAVKNRNRMAFEETKAQNTVLAYNKYIKDYTGSEYMQQAIKLRNEAAFAAAKNKNSLMAYEGFISLYPSALQIPEAKKMQHQLMYEKAMRIKTLAAYNEFIRKYPDGAYYIDVYNLKAEDLGKQYFQQLAFNPSSLKWVKALDNNEQIDVAQAMATTPDGGFIIAGTTQATDAPYTDAWIVKLDRNGEMLWNKTAGQAFNDNIQSVLVTSDNEVILVGNTQVSSDSANYMGWMFKLAADGSKKWNKNLGDITITAAAIAPSNKVYLATHVEDTIADKFYIQAMNLDGQKVWEREYVRTGNFNSINFTETEDVLLSGSQWTVLTDSKFYFKWEDTLSIPGTFEYADVYNNNAVLISSDSVNKHFFSYSPSGLQRGSATIISDADEKVLDILALSESSSIVISETSTSSKLTKVGVNGSKTGSKEVSNQLKFIKAIKTNTGQISYLLKGKDFVILTLSSAGF